MRTLPLVLVCLLTGCHGLVGTEASTDAGAANDEQLFQADDINGEAGPSADLGSVSDTTDDDAADHTNASSVVDESDPRTEFSAPVDVDDGDDTTELQTAGEGNGGNSSSAGEVNTDANTLNEVVTTAPIDQTSRDSNPDASNAESGPTADDTDGDDGSDNSDPSDDVTDDVDDVDDADIDTGGTDDSAGDDSAGDDSAGDDSAGDDSDPDDTGPDDSDSSSSDLDDSGDDSTATTDDTELPDPLSVAPAIRASTLEEDLLNSDLLPFPATLNEADDIAHVPVMQTFSRSLGGCEACHASDYGVWTPQKYVAVHMFEDIVTQLRFKDGGVLYCDSCHQGEAQFLDRSDPQAVELWMQVNLVDKLERVDGEPHGCETCHGSPPNYQLIDQWSTD